MNSEKAQHIHAVHPQDDIPVGAPSSAWTLNSGAYPEQDVRSSTEPLIGMGPVATAVHDRVSNWLDHYLSKPLIGDVSSEVPVHAANSSPYPKADSRATYIRGPVFIKGETAAKAHEKVTQFRSEKPGRFWMGAIATGLAVSIALGGTVSAFDTQPTEAQAEAVAPEPTPDAVIGEQVLPGIASESEEAEQPVESYLTEVPGGQPLVDLYTNHKDQIDALAEEYGIGVPFLIGIMHAESGGRSYGPDGRPIIRVEIDNINEVTGLQLPDPHFGEPYVSPEAEYRILESAMQALIDADLDPNIVLDWTSIGGGQMLIQHYAELGYSSRQEMMDTYAESEAAMIRDMLIFVSNRSDALEAAKRGDPDPFGLTYNGSSRYGAEHLAPGIALAEQALAPFITTTPDGSGDSQHAIVTADNNG